MTEQHEIVDHVAGLIEHSECEKWPQLFWILSKAAPEAALSVVVGVISRKWRQMDNETAIQAFFALDSLMFLDIDGAVLGQNADLLKDGELLNFLRRVDSPEVSLRISTVPDRMACVERIIERESE